MKILSINLGNYGSTGKIASGIGQLAKATQISYKLAYPFSDNSREINENDIIIGGKLNKKLHYKFALYAGFHGCFSFIPTVLFIRKIKRIKPDIIHLHNIHGWYINIPYLFRYIKKSKVKVVWTLHDCWSFTGHCPHFTMTMCDKWKTGCYHCPQYREYPAAYVDRTKTMWNLKRKWFSSVQNMTIVTPSQWLADLVKQSYLKDYPVKVINNGIDLNVFKPTQSIFREKHSLTGKFIVLGVAFNWGRQKGLDVFIELSMHLDNDKYKIVLVGTDDKTDEQLPDNILSIHRTQNQIELAQIYTAADVFANPTREENYPTVNMEALACGIPVITFRTGGSPEIIDSTCGSVVDVDTLEQEIIRVCGTGCYTKEACLKKAESFKMNNRFQEYVDLYKDICCDFTV